MDDLLARIDGLNLPLNAAASPPDIEVLESELDCTLPDDLRTLYLHHDGSRNEQGNSLPMRLLPLAEVREMYSDWIDDLMIDVPDHSEFRVFFTDDNSNYAAVFTAGPLVPRVLFFDHEDPLIVPSYRSPRSFIGAMVTGAEARQQWYELPRDYGTGQGGTPEEVESDLAVHEELQERLAMVEEEENRELLYNQMIWLTPSSRLELLLEYLNPETPSSALDACCRIIGERRYEPALPKLMEMAQSDDSSRWTAIETLGDFGTTEVRELLIELACSDQKGRRRPVAVTLEKCGCEIDQQGGNFRFRVPGDETWQWIFPRGEG